MSSGMIEVVCGPMFSGKTEELIRRIRRAQFAKQKIQVFKPQIDVRYDDSKVVSHSFQSLLAIPVDEKRPMEILNLLDDATRVVAIDEVQFFDAEIIQLVRRLSRRGLRVILAGLDQDFRGLPFGPMPELLCMADSVSKITAICTRCGAPATKTQRLAHAVSRTQAHQTVLVGETDYYEARCGNHHEFGEDAPVSRETFAETTASKSP